MMNRDGEVRTLRAGANASQKLSTTSEDPLTREQHRVLSEYFNHRADAVAAGADNSLAQFAAVFSLLMNARNNIYELESGRDEMESDR